MILSHKSGKFKSFFLKFEIIFFLKERKMSFFVTGLLKGTPQSLSIGKKYAIINFPQAGIWEFSFILLGEKTLARNYPLGLSLDPPKSGISRLAQCKNCFRKIERERWFNFVPSFLGRISNFLFYLILAKVSWSTYFKTWSFVRGLARTS